MADQEGAGITQVVREGERPRWNRSHGWQEDPLSLVGCRQDTVRPCDALGEPSRVVGVTIRFIEDGAESRCESRTLPDPDAGPELVLASSVHHLSKRHGTTTEGTPASSARLLVPCAPE